MVAENGQNSENSKETFDPKYVVPEKSQNSTTSQAINKDENVAVRETPSFWKSPLKCIINITEFLERAKSYAQLVTEDGLLANTVEQKKI